MEKMLISIYDYFYYVELDVIEDFISSELFEASDYWTYLFFIFGVYDESADSIKIKDLIFVNLLFAILNFNFVKIYLYLEIFFF